MASETDERLATDEDRVNLFGLGLDFGDTVPRVEHVDEDGGWIMSELSEYGKSLADRSARNPRGWDHTSRHDFNPYSVPRKRESQAFDAATRALEKMFAPHLRDTAR